MRENQLNFHQLTVCTVCKKTFKQKNKETTTSPVLTVRSITQVNGQRIRVNVFHASTGILICFRKYVTNYYANSMHISDDVYKFIFSIGKRNLITQSKLPLHYAAPHVAHQSKYWILRKSGY